MGTEGRPGFGEVLRRYRTVAGLTQEALAERAHLSARAIAALERGVNRTPRRDTLHLLAEALALSAQARAELEAAARRPAVPDAPAPPLVTSQPPLVGRMRERALLARHLAGEGPPLLLLAGEPGIGKSRLLQETAHHGAGYGLRVLQGGCRQRGGQEPYAPLLDALARHLRPLLPAQARAALRGCAWLVRLLPELAEGPVEPLASWTLPPEQERRLMFEAVSRFLANVAGPAGTLLLLDDLQWAGPDALDLLRTLAHAAGEVRLRVVGAYRDTEVGPDDPLSTLLADLAHAGLATHRTLAPLAPEEAGQLLDDLLKGMVDDRTALRERVVQRASGVPFFVVSCAQTLQRDDRKDAVPWDITQSVRQRVAALPEAARDVLDVAAVVGRVVPRARLLGVAARPEDEVVAAFDAACQARLLEEQGEEAYQFAHDVIREVVEADLGAARRTLLHRRVAEALERQPGDPPIESLAYHYARSGEREKALLYVEQAGDRARAQYANAAAEGYYRQVVDRLRELGRIREAAAVCEKLGAVLRLMGRYDATLAVLEQAADTYKAVGDNKLLAMVEEERPWLLLQLGGRAEEAFRMAEETGRAAEADGDLELLGGALEVLGMISMFRGEFDTSLRYYDRVLDVAERQNSPTQVANVLANRAVTRFWMGQWEQARRELKAAVAMQQQSGVDPLAFLIYLGRISLAEGAWDELARSQEDCVAMAERRGDLLCLRWAQSLLAERDMLLGQPEAARARLVPLLDRPGLEEFFVNRFLPVLAWAHLELGEIGEAEEVVAQAIRRLRADNIRLYLADALRVQAMVAIRQERWDEAEAALEEGLSMARTMPYPYAEARLLHVYGQMHLQRGEPEPARERLEAALAIFERLGARKDVERVEQALSTLQSAPPCDAAVPARPSLPARQRIVAGAPASRRLSRAERQTWALEHLRTVGPLSPRAYATALDVSVDTALRDLQELVDRGLVRAAGMTRDRRYVLAGDGVRPAIHRTAP